jgi:predicted ribosome quality control (RQC) complex YloA/Tae2 family protein
VPLAREFSDIRSDYIQQNKKERKKEKKKKKKRRRIETKRGIFSNKSCKVLGYHFKI